VSDTLCFSRPEACQNRPNAEITLPANVLVLFSRLGYVPAMPGAGEPLHPADPRDLVVSIALALTKDTRLAKAQSAEVMATIVAERIVERLARDRFVVMRLPPVAGAGELARGPRE
jgi:hypothetical protein